MIDWGIAASLTMAVLALAGAATTYGMQRQKINDIAARQKRIEADQQRIWIAVDGINHTNKAVTALQGSIETLTKQMEAGHTLMLTKLEASDRFTGARMDDLGRRVESAFRTGTKVG